MDGFAVDHVRIPMSDGVELSTSVWRPLVERKVPVLLLRTPYGKDQMAAYMPPQPDVLRLVAAGYALVVQDCRGTFDSAGDFEPLTHEVSDGRDTLDWITDQPWCAPAG